jgi:hypothetical protein
MQCHADGAKTGAAQPGAIESGGAGWEVGGGSDEGGEGGGKGFDSFEGEERDDRVGVAGVEGFD